MISPSIRSTLFRGNLDLLPQMNEIYELELAYAESQQLSPEELVRRGAYFASVNGEDTHHFRLCAGDSLLLPSDGSANRRRFFERNQFRTGYATHGLFPYRGKFHPQMIKGIINMMGIRPGDTILDPTMGSGTTLVEACSMGIHSTGIDASPFCVFMAQAKLAGFRTPLSPLRNAVERSTELHQFFLSLRSQSQSVRDASESHLPRTIPDGLPSEWFASDVWPILLLASLDAAGFAERSTRGTPLKQFQGIIERYLFVVEKLQTAASSLNLKFGNAQALQGDAKQLPLPNDCMDGIIFSPPYSFAVDYVGNDAPHLSLFGVDLDLLRNRMIGLRGNTLRAKYDHYCADMAKVMNECSRVLRSGKYCTVIIGTNNLQLGKLLNIPPNQVEGLDMLVVKLADAVGLSFKRRLSRRIHGMANTMRDEDILLFQKTSSA